MERKWSETIWGISLYMKNGLSSDISFGPLNELKVRTKQITSNLLKQHLLKELESLKEKDIDYQQVGWNFVYLIRKIKIALYRNNDIYAYQLLNDARYQVINIEGYNEKQKMHEFKAYNELDKSFLDKIYLTIPNSIDRQEIERCYKILLDIF